MSAPWWAALVENPDKLGRMLHPEAPDMAVLFAMYIRNLRRDAMDLAAERFITTALLMIKESREPSSVWLAREAYKESMCTP